MLPSCGWSVDQKLLVYSYSYRMGWQCPKTDASDESREAVEFPDSLKAQKEKGGKMKQHG